MSLIKWEPLSEFDHLRDERFLPSLPKLGWDLAIDMYEENNNVVAAMNLPGMTPKEIDIEIEGDTLIISGQRREEQKSHEKNYYSKEIRRGSFTRTTTLPKTIKAAKSSATLADGMLIITMPVDTKAKYTLVSVPITSP